MPLLAVTGLAREARIIQGTGLRIVVSGGRTHTLHAKLAEALQGDVSGIISIGIGGGLRPTLRTGDAVIGSAVLVDGRRIETDMRWAEALRRALPRASAGSVIASDEMVTDALQKHELHRRTGALALDMESGAVAMAAKKAGLPFAILRVISDPAKRGLPPAVKVGMKPDGGMNIGGVIKALAADPRQLPALITAALDAEAAFRSLFRCRQTLGPSLGLPDFGKLALDVT